jgi:hypothetical protein
MVKNYFNDCPFNPFIPFLLQMTLERPEGFFENQTLLFSDAACYNSKNESIGMDNYLFEAVKNKLLGVWGGLIHA